MHRSLRLLQDPARGPFAGCLIAAAGLAGCAAPLPSESPTPTPEARFWGSHLPQDYRPDAPRRAVFLGDSITAGAGAPSHLEYRGLLVDNDPSWPDYDGRDLTSWYPDLTDVISVAVGGATSSALVENQLPALSERLGDEAPGETIAVFTIGGNDMLMALASVLTDHEDLGWQRVDNLLENVDTILDYFDDEARFPDGTWVYFANVYEPTDGVGSYPGCFSDLDVVSMLPFLDEVDIRMRELAEARGVAQVNLRGHFQGHGFWHDDPDNPLYRADDPTLWFVDDCIHPNERGHHEVRRLFVAALEGTDVE